VPQERAVDRIALLVGLLGAVIGPFVLLAISGTDPASPDQASLPWYVLVLVILVVLVVIGVGFLMFTRESHPEDTSISPDRRAEDGAKDGSP
jgi:heme/copper-type cytochrome/quinol oxidase subunit 2